MPRKPLSFVVTIEPPANATVARVKAYIESAVACERGLLHPEDPMFELNTKTLKVRLFRTFK